MSVNRTLIILALIFCGVSAAPLSLSAENKGITLELCYVEYAPLATKKGTGISVRIMNAIFAEIPLVNAKLTLMPWVSCQSAAIRGRMDGVLHLFYSPERGKHFAFTNQLFSLEGYFYFVKSKFPDGFAWKSLDDLKPYTLGVQKGTFYGEELEAYLKRKGSNIDVTDDDKLNYRKLVNNRFDVLADYEPIASQFIRTQGFQSVVKRSEKPFYASPLFMAISKKSKHSDIVPKINEAIKSLKGKGVIDKIIYDAQ